jgi:hypothetical protein
MRASSLAAVLTLVAAGAALADPPSAEPTPPVGQACHTSLLKRLHGLLHHDAAEPCGPGLVTHPYPFCSGSGTVPPCRSDCYYDRFGPGWGVNAVQGFPGVPSVNLVGGKWW